MYLGQYTYMLDDKGRLTIPSRYREELPSEVVVTRGMDRCLALYPPRVWQELSDKVTSLPLTNPRGRALRRHFFAPAANLELDRQGRILIPEHLREYAGLDLSSEVLVIGLYNFIELWNPQRWHDQNEQQLAELDEDHGIWEGVGI